MGSRNKISPWRDFLWDTVVKQQYWILLQHVCITEWCTRIYHWSKDSTFCVHNQYSDMMVIREGEAISHQEEDRNSSIKWRRNKRSVMWHHPMPSVNFGCCSRNGNVQQLQFKDRRPILAGQGVVCVCMYLYMYMYHIYMYMYRNSSCIPNSSHTWTSVKDIVATLKW